MRFRPFFPYSKSVKIEALYFSHFFPSSEWAKQRNGAEKMKKQTKRDNKTLKKDQKMMKI